MRTAVLFLILSLSTIISKAQFSQEYQYARAEYWERSFMKLSNDNNVGKAIRHPVTGENLSKRLAESGAKTVSEIEYDILSRLLSEYNAQTRVNLDTAKLIYFFAKKESNTVTYLIWNKTDTIYSYSTYASIKNDQSKTFAVKFNKALTPNSDYLIKIMNLVSTAKDGELESAIKQIESFNEKDLRYVSNGSEYQIYTFRAKNKKSYDVKSVLFKD